MKVKTEVDLDYLSRHCHTCDCRCIDWLKLAFSSLIFCILGTMSIVRIIVNPIMVCKKCWNLKVLLWWWWKLNNLTLPHLGLYYDRTHQINTRLKNEMSRKSKRKGNMTEVSENINCNRTTILARCWSASSSDHWSEEDKPIHLLCWIFHFFCDVIEILPAAFKQYKINQDWHEYPRNMRTETE